MRILIIGLGSIGIRHAKALLTLDNIQIAALRTKRGNKEIGIELEKKLIFFYSDSEAINWKPTHIIISNPTSLHITYLKKFINISTKIFVEKPISDNLTDIEGVNINKNQVYVGYNLRFHQLIQTVKQVITDNTFGKPIAAELNVGHYLPSWHPYEDYKTGYAARKELGGGVLRTLSHEIDLLQYFFGDIKSVFAKVSKVSLLEIDVDDYTTIISETQDCKRTIINLNYLNPISSRTGKIFLEQGVLEYSFTENTVTFVDYKTTKEQILLKNKTDFNQQYIEQMKDFISPDTNNVCTYKQGINVMRIIDVCELSNNEKKEICLD